MWVVGVALGAAPSLFLMIFFYLKDRYEPEPRGHVAFAFLKGALSVAPAFLTQMALERLVGREWLALGGAPAKAFEVWVMASLAEELPKWLIFIGFIYRWNELDEPLDGVVYGVALALGFATVENILCVLRDGYQTGILRAVFAVPAHALFGASMGYFFGRAKLGDGKTLPSPPVRRRRLALALAVPMIFHGFYDWSLVEFRGPWLYVVVGALSVSLWIFVLRRVHRAQHDSPFRR